MEHMEVLDNLVNEFEQYEEQLKKNKRHDTDVAKEIVKSLVLTLGGSGKIYPYKALGYPGDPNRNRKRKH
jgi:hypothetical protein